MDSRDLEETAHRAPWQRQLVCTQTDLSQRLELRSLQSGESFSVSGNIITQPLSQVCAKSRRQSRTVGSTGRKGVTHFQSLRLAAS